MSMIEVKVLTTFRTLVTCNLWNHMYFRWQDFRVKMVIIGFLMFSCGSPVRACWAEHKYNIILAVFGRGSELWLLKFQEKNRVSSSLNMTCWRLCLWLKIIRAPLDCRLFQLLYQSNKSVKPKFPQIPGKGSPQRRAKLSDVWPISTALIWWQHTSVNKESRKNRLPIVRSSVWNFGLGYQPCLFTLYGR